MNQSPLLLLGFFIGAYIMLDSRYVSIDGKKIHYLSRESQRGTNAPESEGDEQKTLLILFHGFPENSHAWEPFIRCTPEHVDVIAPDLPGYHLSEVLPSQRDYEVPALIKRMVLFIESVKQGRKIVLIGHDWGGAIAWPLAAFHSELIDKLVILNAAHPSTFTQSLITSKTQREKSQYIDALRDNGAENMLADTNFSLLREMLGASFFKREHEYANSLLNDWQDKTKLNAMLSYYRNMPQKIPGINASPDELANIHVPNINISLETLVLWGREDNAFDTAVLQGIEHYVPHCKVIYHDTASHWIHREYSDWAAINVIEFIEA